MLAIALPEGLAESMPVGAAYTTLARARVKKVPNCMDGVGMALLSLRWLHGLWDAEEVARRCAL